jgi:ferrous iron transport protein B
VGKSVLFNALTGAYATVSNYPGTTVEVMRGQARIGGRQWEVLDTPGMYSLLPSTEEERVSQAILMQQRADVVLHVVDAKNLERMLPLTLQLLEAGLPVILVLNLMDEAERRGIQVNLKRLEQELGIPVVATVSTTGRGVKELRAAIAHYQPRPRTEMLTYGEKLEEGIAAVSELLPPDLELDRRAVALLLLQGDEETAQRLGTGAEVAAVVAEHTRRHAQPLAYLVATRRQRRASELATAALEIPEARDRTTQERLSELLINPWTGIPILALVLYFGLYKFVGGLGAGLAVDLLEHRLFMAHVNPWIQGLVDHNIPWPAARSLIAGEYGLVTLGLRYAVGIILPIVTFFFLAFSVMEDSGYLPRLALLIDRVFKQIGLSGRGVIPMVLGLGCATMATLVTRTLPTRRERVIATLLLAVAVPCSAQMGVIMSLLHARPALFAIWAGVVVLVFLFIGFLAARVLPGEAPHFFMELPPMRLPRLSNVFMKTYTRVEWYLKEILPMFLLASLLIWLGQLTGVFDWLVGVLAHPVTWIGLPPEAGKVFLFGFFRRDYGAAGLYDLDAQGLLTGVQLVVGCIALTLFLPCVAQFLMNIKERGAKMGLAISLFTLVFSFVVAAAINGVLRGLGVHL